MTKIALVTGANKGIGFEIVKQLAEKEITVILTARDETKGKKAIEKLKKKNIIFCQLDVNDQKSIDKAFEFVEKKFGRLDILVNNAGVYLDEKKTPLNVDRETVRKTLETNTVGPLFMSQKFIPLMKKNKYGRIVNISSGAGQLSSMDDYYSAYAISKTALNAITRMLAAATKGTDILVNSVCPGWVRTDMGGSDAERDVEKGAETPVWLATLPVNGPTGKFFRDKEEIEW
ncbi:MAG: SDR family oxidoreductase [Candidatus Aenigmatarchaeota archaeon]